MNRYPQVIHRYSKIIHRYLDISIKNTRHMCVMSNIMPRIISIYGQHMRPICEIGRK
jgi:hypothetical protein